MKYFSNRKTVISSIVVVLMLVSTATLAKDTPEIAKVRANMMKMMPGAENVEIVKSPVENVYRIKVRGQYVYVLTKGDFVLIGDMFDTKKQVNLGDQVAAEAIAKRLKDVPVDKMIVFGPKNPKRYITVFTDIDCGYCRKLHNEVPELVKAGIQVRYMAFPRAGVGSNSFDKYVSVWCAKDPLKAMTNAKNGIDPEPALCKNPISETYKIGQEVGVSGTPTIVYDDGAVRPGYIPYKDLIKELGLSSEPETKKQG